MKPHDDLVLRQQSFLTITILLGLAPEFKYPVPVLECVAAYEYLTNSLKVQLHLPTTNK